MSERVNYEVFLTPVGELVYPWVTRADTRFNKDGVFHTKIALAFEDAQELIAKLEGVLKGFYQSLDTKQQATYNMADVYEPELGENGEPTGRVLFNAKLKALVTPKEGDSFEQHVVVISCEDGAAIEEAVFGGTTAKLKGQIVPYTNNMNKVAGVTLRLRSIQIHELVTGDGAGFWTEFGETA